MNASDLLMWFTTVALRIYVRIAAGQQHTVHRIHNARQVIRARNQRYVHGQTAGGFHGLAVIARKIESIRFQFDAHRDADARPVVVHRLTLTSLPRPDSVHHNANASLLPNLLNVEAGKPAPRLTIL